MTAQFGIGMFFYGMTITFIGFYIAFLVINYNQREEKKKKIKETGPVADLHRLMPWTKYGDDCQ